MVTENRLVPKKSFLQNLPKEGIFGLKRTTEAALLGDWVIQFGTVYIAEYP